MRSDPARAIELLERAAEAGVVEAWWDLARIYNMPRFSGRDPRRARECLERAAREHVAPAQRALGERLAARGKDLQAWLTAGRWLSLALEGGESAAVDTLSGIADSASAPSAEESQAEESAIAVVREKMPALAARLALAFEFCLTEREALCMDTQRMDQGWCLLADVSIHFRYKPWRLTRIERPSQREALTAAVAIFNGGGAEPMDLPGVPRARSKRFARLMERLAIDPKVFFRGEGAPLKPGKAAA